LCLKFGVVHIGASAYSSDLVNAESNNMDLATWMTVNDVVDDELGTAVGLARGYINRIRHGDVHPSLGAALSIVDASGGEVDIRTLLPKRLRGKFTVKPLRSVRQGAAA
jgi:hypothetical protein